ncbi:MAG: hypothetical protein IKH78_02865 [Ruminococcus sp.]|nr:hypothetical protein [Ruminococcus sp.]
MGDENIKNAPKRRITRKPAMTVRGPARKGRLASKIKGFDSNNSLWDDCHGDTYKDSPYKDGTDPDKTGGRLRGDTVKKHKDSHIIRVSKKLTRGQLLKLASCNVTVNGNHLVVPEEKLSQVREILDKKEK